MGPPCNNLNWLLLIRQIGPVSGPGSGVDGESRVSYHNVSLPGLRQPGIKGMSIDRQGGGDQLAPRSAVQVTRAHAKRPLLRTVKTSRLPRAAANGAASVAYGPSSPDPEHRDNDQCRSGANPHHQGSMLLARPATAICVLSPNSATSINGSVVKKIPWPGRSIGPSDALPSGLSKAWMPNAPNSMATISAVNIYGIHPATPAPNRTAAALRMRNAVVARSITGQ